MNYGERVKYVREKLGMSRMAFASAINTSETYVANIENSKDGSRKFGRNKEKEIIKMAGLPPGYFVDDEIGSIKVSNEELFYQLFPNAKEKINYSEAVEFINMALKIKQG